MVQMWRLVYFSKQCVQDQWAHASSGKLKQALDLKTNALSSPSTQRSNWKDSVSPVQVHQNKIAYSFFFSFQMKVKIINLHIHLYLVI